jgi:cell division protein FtsI (penicillin-binding protein 3)/stage V sporulation protein D (sporulation-specific penicillin-binding protein)
MPRISRSRYPRRHSQWIALAAAFLLIGVNLVRLHLFPDPRVKAQASKQYWAQVPISTSRGGIFDRNGVPLALSVPSESFFIDPAYWDPANASALKGLVGDGELARFQRSLPGRFVWVRRKVPLEMARAYTAKDIPGLFSLKESARVYPHGQLAAHLLGFCDIDDNGLSGIERAWNNTLFSPQQTRLLARDARGKLLDIVGNSSDEDYTASGNIYLSIDSRIQQILEENLAVGVRDSNATWGAAICIDPNDGAVLGLASYPTFNPNDRGSFKNPEALRNNVIGRIYEPGSTLKPLVMGLAMEEGLVNQSDRFICSGSIRVADHVIRDVKRGGHGVEDPKRVIVNSCNVGMAMVGIRFHVFRFYQGLKLLGMGQRTGIDLAGEEAGLLQPPERWLGVVPANVAIGQGVGVTPVQLVSAIGAIANGGHLLKPYVVKEVRDDKGEVIYRGKRVVKSAVFSPGVAKFLRESMRGVVVEGTGKGANTPLEKVAGKTGTAQVATGGTYQKGHYVASFVGFWPYDSPRYVLLVVIGEPKGGKYYGGELAAPVFKAMVESISLLPKDGKKR